MTVEEWLIDAVKERPIIWNVQSKNYKNTKLKNEAYEQIAKEYNMPVQEIKKKWHSIRSAFSRELRMRNLYTSMGSNQKREWKHFTKLMFLQEECRLEIDGQVQDEEYAVQLLSEDDASSTLYNLTNNDNDNNNNNNSSTVENEQTTTTTSSHSSISNNKDTNNSTTTKQTNNAKKRKTNNSSASISPQKEASKHTLTQNTFHNSMPKLSEEEIFGQSIAASLRKFDQKKKEIVKLKLQEVIVQYLDD